MSYGAESSMPPVDSLIEGQKTFGYSKTMLKRAGILQLRTGTMIGNYEDGTAGVNLERGDKFLEIHLDISNSEQMNPVELAHRMKDSINQLSQFLIEENLTDRTIVGFTMSKTAKLVTPFGFHVTQNIPPERAEAVRLLFQHMPETTGRELGEPVLCAIQGRELVENVQGMQLVPQMTIQ